jgi:predicted transcriptional regulator
VVTALAPRTAVTASEAEGFVERTFGGSLPGFLTAFMSGKHLTADEAEALKRLIDQHRED